MSFAISLLLTGVEKLLGKVTNHAALVLFPTLCLCHSSDMLSKQESEQMTRGARDGLCRCHSVRDTCLGVRGVDGGLSVDTLATGLSYMIKIYINMRLKNVRIMIFCADVAGKQRCEK